MADKNDESRKERPKQDAEFKKMYQYFTSASVQLASDKLFAASAEELAEHYKRDNDSVWNKFLQFINQSLKLFVT